METYQNTMKNIYLYGASDDCNELETDFGVRAESYSGLKINDVFVEYEFDGDWKIKLVGDIPSSWIVRIIEGNSVFIHIQIPNDEDVTVYEPVEEETITWEPIQPR